MKKLATLTATATATLIILTVLIVSCLHAIRASAEDESAFNAPVVTTNVVSYQQIRLLKRTFSTDRYGTESYKYECCDANTNVVKVGGQKQNWCHATKTELFIEEQITMPDKKVADMTKQEYYGAKVQARKNIAERRALAIINP